MGRLTVATLNLLYYPVRWPERRSLILDGFRELQPDIIGLQEVSHIPPDAGTTADWLAAELGGYSVHYVPQEAWVNRSFGRFGIAILSRRPVLEQSHSQLSLGSQGRVAQRVIVQGDAGPFVFCNGHFHFSPSDSKARTRQIERLLAWLDDLPPGLPIVAVGDFNGTPDTEAIRLMRTRFRSAHAVRHGREPAYTCPTPLVYRGHWLRWVAGRVLSLGTVGRWEGWRGVLDYIFVNGRFEVEDCRVNFERPSDNDRRLYASDHFGLWAGARLS